MTELSIRSTAIPGLLLLELPVHGDPRGWFKENWQREKMVAAGLPDFRPVQNNVSFNAQIGVTRGFHAEPWDKLVSVGAGRVFGAWADLREGPSFGTVVTCEIGPGTAVFVPRGVANGFQTLQEDTVYSYLVNDHWSPELPYDFVNLADPQLAVPWPIPLEQCTLSEKDRPHPMLAEVTPVPPRRVLVLGAHGQVARALADAVQALPEAERARFEFAGHEELDLLTADLFSARPWKQYEAVVNAAAMTDVDGAETPEGRVRAWALNASVPAALARISREHGVRILHISSDYVFDGSRSEPISEEQPLAPLGVYGQSKAAGDLALSAAQDALVLRTSWVIGQGRNFAGIMRSLAGRGIRPDVVEDQIGRLTFASEIARAILFALERPQMKGVFNLTCSGNFASWAQVARRVFELSGAEAEHVNGVSTEAYFADRPHAAPRPLNSRLDLSKIRVAGFEPRPWEEMLEEHLRQQE